MRLKSTPEDFLVREATALRIRREPAPYRVYMLEKTGWNTTDALIRVAKASRVSYGRIGYGGKKDRHAHTFQYITGPSGPDLTCLEKGYQVRFLGYSTEPMGPDKITANHFELTVRELSADEAAVLTAAAPGARDNGIPNYFDDQRFGNLDRERGFVAERMLLGRWEEALDLALTTIHPEENREAKERKRALRESWGDWAACAAVARTAFEQRSLTILSERPGAFRDALATAPAETAAMWVSTYQSFLWNEVLRRWIRARGWAGAEVAGPAGPYVFLGWGGPPEDAVIPVPGRGMRFPIPETGELLETLLRERRLRPAALEAELLPGLAMRAFPRPALMRPAGIWVEGPEPDDRYPGRLKLGLRFSLPRGSYATMLIKALTAAGGRGAEALRGDRGES